VVTEPRSYTGRYLAPLLGRGASPLPSTGEGDSPSGERGDGLSLPSGQPNEGAAAVAKRVRRRKSEAVAAE